MWNQKEHDFSNLVLEFTYAVDRGRSNDDAVLQRRVGEHAPRVEGDTTATAAITRLNLVGRF
jgi:hypothetical protein